MIAGKLDRRITIERQGPETDDGLTTVPGEFAPLATVWASYEPVSDAERDRAQQVGASRTARFVIRWSSTVSDVNPADQLVFEDRRFAISGAKELGRREGIEITATAQAEALA